MRGQFIISAITISRGLYDLRMRKTNVEIHLTKSVEIIHVKKEDKFL